MSRAIEARAGDQIHRWRLLARLGNGSFGEVWRATDDAGRIGALKRLSGPPGAELLALARVCHPAVPALLDAQGGACPMLVMALAEGRPLSSMLRHGAAPEAAALTIGVLLGDALSALHRAGVIHGDIKPDNIVVGSVQRREVMLIDFGMVSHEAGGTLSYAAPERLRGGSASPEADVYALGLVLWEMLHGQLPWARLGLSASLSRRQRGAPVSVSVPNWLGELLTRMLATDPERRPTAAQLTDQLAAQGYAPAQLSTTQLRERATVAYVPRPAVDTAGAAWQQSGGVLALHGPAGSGRTAALRQVIATLQASGRPWVRFRVDGGPWCGIAQALRMLGGPDEHLSSHPDPDERSVQAADRLEALGGCELAVVVDDWERMDSESQMVLRELAWRGAVPICVAGSEVPAWSDQAVVIGPISAADLSALVRRLLGAEQLADALGQRLARLTGGLVGPAVDFLIAACGCGALQQRAGRWLADEELLDTLETEGFWTVAPAPPTDPVAAQLGGLIALSRAPLQVEKLGSVSGLEETPLRTALAALQQQQLVKQEQGAVFCEDVGACRALREACPDPKAACRRLLAACAPDAIEAGWYAVGAADRLRLEADGVEMLQRVRRRSVKDAAALGAEMWAIVPGCALAIRYGAILREAGQTEEAAAFITAQRARWPEAPGLWVALARVKATEPAAAADVLALIAHARALPGAQAVALESAICASEAHSRLGDSAAAIAAAKEALEQVQPGSPEAVADWLHLALVCAQYMAAAGQLEEAIGMCQAVPAPLGQGLPSRALLEAALGRLLWMAGRPKDAAERMARAAEAGQGLSANDRARLLNNVGLVQYTIGERLKALRSWEDCLPLMERLQMVGDQVRVHNNLCVGYREVGRWERARQAGTWALEHAEAAGLPDVGALAAGNLGDIAADCRDVAAARLWYDRAEELARAHAVEGELAELDRRRAALAVDRWEPGAADAARLAAQSAEAVGDQDNAHRARALLGLCLAREGDIEEAEQILFSTVQALREAGTAGLLAEVRLWAAEAWCAAGWPARAMADCERARAYAEELGLVPLRDRADRIRSQIGERTSGQATNQLDVLLSLATRLSRESDEQTLLQAIADGARQLLCSDRAFVITFEAGETRIAARSGDGEAQPSQSIVSRVHASQREVIVADLLERGDLRAAQSVLAMELRSAMCAPMLDHGELLGAIYIDSRHVSEQRLSAATPMLRALAAYGAVAVVSGRRIRKQVEQTERAAEVVHDLRAPVATMMTLADEVVSRGAEVEVGLEILSLGRRALRLAEGLLSEADEDSTVFSASSVVTELCRQTAAVARAQQRQIHCQADDGVELLGQPEMMRRLLSNLLSNAFRYGAGDIEVALSQADGAVVLTVRDHGAGIPDELLPRLFERGVRAGGGGSHGLGTAIAMRMVSSLQGSLHADNHPDGGARFTARFPAPQEAAA